MENSWERAIKADLKVVVKVKPQYIGDSMRPSSFNMDYTIAGKPHSRTLSNVAGQKF